MPRNVEYLQDWCRRNRFPAPASLSAAAAPDNPLRDAFAQLREDFDRQLRELTAVVDSALEALDSFDRDIVHDLVAIQTLHGDVRAAIDDGFKEFGFRVAGALKEFKLAIVNATAEG